MRTLAAAAALALLCACGVETAGTAATAAAVKKQELDAGKKAAEQLKQDLGKALEQTQKRADGN